MDAKPPAPVELVSAPRAPARPPAATPAAPPAPARVREGRGRGADLFGNIEREGGEDALLGSTSLSQYEEKPIGARNESSVLFSLDALKAGARRGSSAPPRTPSSPPQQTAADILGMTAGGALPGMGSGGSVSGLPGMGAVGPLFSAPAVDAPLPVFSSPEPPPRSRMDTLPPTMRGRRSMTVPIAVVIAAIFVLGAAILVLHNRFSSTPKVAEDTTAEATAYRPKTEPTTTVARAAEPVAPTNEPAAPTSEPRAAQPTPEPAAQPVATAAAPVAPHEPRPSAHPEKPAAKAGTAPSNVEALKAAMRPDDGQGATKPPSDKGAATEKLVLAEDTSGGDNTGADTPEPPKPPFDTSAAKAALEAASSSAASCKKDDGPTGRGKVQVTFSPAGRATSANVIEGPFGGTTVGGCVAKIFRGAKVPPFSGDAVTVSKSFTIPE